jgi:HAD superfamily hydrolase (TIGR01509 family)
MIRALVFDFDGLILDTEGPVFQSWQELYQEYGCELSFEKWATIIGTAERWFDPLDDLETCLRRKAGEANPANQTTFLDRQCIKPRRLQRELDLIHNKSVQPGVRDYLEKAKQFGLKIGLASSSTCRWVTGHLARLDLLDYFDDIQARDDVERAKPDPSLYLAVLGHLGVDPETAVAFEDSPNGILAAKIAGLFCVAVPNPLTRRLSFDHADLCLDSLADVSLEELLTTVEQQILSRIL